MTLAPEILARILHCCRALESDVALVMPAPAHQCAMLRQSTVDAIGDLLAALLMLDLEDDACP